jgi:signal transduction histidine kinase
MLGGDITVQSSLGAGSIFTVTFPIRARMRATPYRQETERRQESA